MKSDEKSLKVGSACRKISVFLLFFAAVVIFAAGFTTAAVDCGEVVSGRNANIYKNAPRITTFTAKRSTCTEKYENYLHFATTEEGSFDETLPEEYGDFIGSLPNDVIDRLPEGAIQEDGGALTDAAAEASGVSYLLSIVFDAFGGAVDGLLPTFTLLCGIVILSAVAHTFAASVSVGLSGVVSFSARLASFCAISGVAVSSLERLSEYFNSLCGAVGAFLPLSGVLYAMGGNLTAATEGTFALSATLSVCQLLLTETVIPVFCICLSLTLLGAFDGAGGFSGQSISATVKKWYGTALGFVMMITTTAVAAQNLISVKADSAAMRGVKFAASNFIPISGGAVSSTLGTLAASVELLRGSVGVIGIVIILLMLIPVIIELAVLRGILNIVAFMAGALGCTGEQRLLSEVSSLYGYLEGIAALSSVVFIISLAIFASSAAAVG